MESIADLLISNSGIIAYDERPLNQWLMCFS